MRNTYDKVHEVVPYLCRYIAHQLKGCRDETSEAYRIKFLLIQYWKNVANSLKGEFGPKEICDTSATIEDSEEGLPKLSYQFWPRTNHGTGYKSNVLPSMENHSPTKDKNVQMQDLEKEFAEEMEGRNEMFIGYPSEKEKQAWNPLEMIQDGSFVCLNPDPVWEVTHGVRPSNRTLFALTHFLGRIT